MVRRALRVALFASFVVLLWTIPRAAYASVAQAATAAPLCDDRGATALAPPPALEASDVAIQRARASAQCAGGSDGEVLFFASIGAAHHGVAPPSADAAQALPATCPRLPPPGSDELDPHDSDAGRPRDGVRSRLDRPPRF
jgi:hypothetical protein